MLDQLKNLVQERLSERMASNQLDDQKTNEAASEGANALMNSLKGIGSLDQVKDLLSGGVDNIATNDIFKNVQGKLKEVLQNKGMSASEADSETARTLPNMIQDIQERFASKAEGDKAFDLNNVTNLFGSIDGKGGLLNKAKDLFGNK